MSSQIDLSYLNLISGDDQEFIKEIVVTFLTEIDSELALLNKYVQSEDWQNAQRTAHKMKSPIHMLMADPLKNIITELESDLKGAKNLDKIPAQNTEFQSLIQTAIKEYRDWLEKTA